MANKGALNLEDLEKDFIGGMKKPQEETDAGTTDTPSNDSEEEIKDEEQEEDQDILNEDESSSEGDDSDVEEDDNSEDSSDEDDSYEDDSEFDLDDWDDDSEDQDDEVEVKNEKPSTDFEALGKELGFENVKDEGSFKSSLSQLKTQIAELESKAEKAEIFDRLPEQLRDAVNLALEGGDYLNYLDVNSVDYSKIDPVDIFVDDVMNSFRDANGNVNEDEAYDYLDGLTDQEKKYRGLQIQRQLVSMQNAQSSKYKQEAKLRAQKRAAEIKEAVKGLNEVSGLKLSPKHKSELANSLMKGSVEKALLGDNFSQKDVAEAVFKIKYFDKIKNKLEQQTKSSTKKETIKSLTNSNVKRNNRQTDAKPKTRSGFDLYMENLMGK